MSVMPSDVEAMVDDVLGPALSLMGEAELVAMVPIVGKLANLVTALLEKKSGTANLPVEVTSAQLEALAALRLRFPVPA